MAYEQFYGSYVSNAARCGVQVEVTENDTQFKLNDPYVYTYPNPNVGVYFATGTSSTKATLSATGQQTRTSTSTTGFTTISVSGGLTWDKTHAAQTITVEAVYEYTDCYRSVDGVKFSGKSTATKSYTIPARTSYTVTLDSNGGTGAASTLEKWHGESLALPQPAKNGYEFSHWTDGTNNYTTTLPANVNEPITLTAVWAPIISAAYITQVYAARDDGSGTWDSQTGKHTSASDDGGYVYIRAWWRVEGADAATVSLGASMDSTPAWTGTAQQTSKPGTGELYIEGVAEWLTGDIADVAEQYDVTVTLSTGTGNPSDTRGTTVSTAFFTIDVLAGGHGIAFGKPATQELFDVGMEASFDQDVAIGGDVDVTGDISGIDITAEQVFIANEAGAYSKDNVVSSGTRYIYIYDGNGTALYRWYFSYAGSLARQKWNGSSWDSAEYYMRAGGVAPSIVAEHFTASSGSIAAGGTKWVTVPTSKSGHTLVGPLGFYVNGTTMFNVYALNKKDDSNCQMAVKNTGSGALSATIEIWALFVRNS